MRVLLKIFGGGVYVVTLYYLARLGLIGLNDTHKLRNIIPVFIVLFHLIPSQKTFFYIVLPFSLLACIVTPISLIYGDIDYQALISLIATNTIEAQEFIAQIPVKYFLQGISIPILAFFAFWVSQKIDIKPWRNKVGVLISISILLFYLKPTNFFENLSSTYQTTSSNLSELNQFVNQSAWNKINKVKTKKDYILIIGESARRDYFSLYGYPIANTPFLNTVPGATIVDGLSAGGTYTIGSLTNMLTVGNKENWQPRYQYNLIDLANEAGIKTYWLSNQGYIGQYDTPVSSIGNRASDIFFFNQGSYSDKNNSDFFLLQPFKEKLRQPSTGTRLFVLHTIGSHPDACRRIYDLKNPIKVNNTYYEYIACYVNSIRKTDIFIKEIYKTLQQNYKESNRDFSIIYFSDHGLCHKEIDNKLIINNNSKSKFHYDIPLIKIDSNRTERITQNCRKSGLNFTEGLATWMGITGKALIKYDLFDGIDDPSDYGLCQHIDEIKQEPDPAVDLTGIVIKQ